MKQVLYCQSLYIYSVKSHMSGYLVHSVSVYSAAIHTLTRLCTTSQIHDLYSHQYLLPFGQPGLPLSREFRTDCSAMAGAPHYEIGTRVSLLGS